MAKYPENRESRIARNLPTLEGGLCVTDFPGTKAGKKDAKNGRLTLF